MQMMNKLPRRLAATAPALNPWIEIILAGAIAILAVFPWLGSRDIWTAGEGRVAQVARQMLHSDNLKGYIIPKLGEDIRLQKPPLAYWMAVLAALPEGEVTEFNSRLPSAIAAVLAALLLCRWGREMIGGYGGLIAAVAFVTTSACWWQARNSTIEMTQLFFILLALYSWWRYDRSVPVYQSPPVTAKPKKRWLLLCYLALGLAAMDKGPIAPPLVFLIIVAYLLFSRRNPFKIRLLDHFLGLLVFFIVTLPWIAAVVWMNGSQQTLDLWFYETDRLEGHDHLKGWWYFILKILGDGQPWVFFGIGGAIASLAGGARERQTPEGQAAAPVERKWLSDNIYFAVVWAVVALVFFSVPNSKKSYYILPIYPALALSAAWCFEALRTSGAAWPRLEKAMVRLCSVAGAVMVIAGLAMPFAVDFLCARVEKFAQYQGHAPQVAAAAGVAVILGCVLVWKARERRWGAVIAWLTLGAFAGFGIHTWLLPDLNAHKGDRLLCEGVRAELRANDRVCTYFSGQSIYRFYLNRHTVRITSSLDLLRELANLKNGQRLLLALKEKDWKDFSHAFYISGKGEAELKRVEAFFQPYLNPGNAPPTMRIFYYSRGKAGWSMILKAGRRRPNVKKGPEAVRAWREECLATAAKVEPFRAEAPPGIKIFRMDALFQPFARPPGQDKGRWVLCTGGAGLISPD